MPHRQVVGQSLLPKEEIFREKEEKKRTLTELEASIERSRMIRYSQQRWNEMRKRLETGEPLVRRPAREIPEAPKRVLPPPPAPGPGLNVILPYESGLAISGRKVIDFKLSSTIFNQEDRLKGRINKTDFQLDQQLQVRVKGTVGRKVTVNVDYDDTRRDEQRNVSVQYTGDPDEVLQEAAFGDITISLPGTEFVHYSKSIFGMRAQLLFRPRTGFARLFPAQLWHRYTPKQLKLYFIGSRTKGITQTKRFTGQTELRRAGGGEGINDVSYLRRQFFLLAFATGPGTTSALEHRPIKIGSERIFLDDQNPFNNNIDETTRTFRVVDTPIALGGVQPSTLTFIGPVGENTGVFRLLVPGVDYTVDYLKGVIRFLRTLQARDVVVVDYVPQGTNAPPISQSLGGSDPLIPNPAADTILGGFQPILLKPDESQFFASRELKNYYDLGAKKIVRDDGRGNFILKIIDTNRQDVIEITGFDVSTQPQTKPLPKYPQDIDVDFENGIFSFVTTDTFRSPNPRPFTDFLYTFRKEDTIPPDRNRYRIFSEYRIRKGHFSLDQFNIVSQSEQVFVDGRRMTRDVDYFIDYDVGIVTFFRPEIIRDDSIVEITYDFSPFGGLGEETLVGLRQEWVITDNLIFGNSLLYNFATRMRGVPDLRSTARSILVLEADATWKNLKFGKFPIEIKNVAAEVAQSIRNSNTAGKATVETFEGIKLEDAANLHRENWQVAANPEKGNPGAGGGAFQPGYATNVSGGRGLFLSNEDWRLLDIDAGLASAVESADRISVLKVNYSFQHQYEAASQVQVLNRAGLDFFSHRRQFLELWIHGDNSKNRIQIRLGRINELSDSGTGLRTEDKNNDGRLGPGEDVGWSFRNPDSSTTTIGANNGRLDSQDLNGNGKIDSEDAKDGNYLQEVGSPENPLREPDGTVHPTIDWSGWKVFQVPLNIATSEQAKIEWSGIRDIRFTVINLSSGATSGELRFGRMAVVGTRFSEPTIDPSTAPLSARVFAENSLDNPGYPTLIHHANYRELYEIEDVTVRRREQALAIEYQRTAAVEITTITTKQVFTRPLDFSEHETLNFFLFGDLSGNRFIFRIGSPGNYFEYRTELTFSGWRLIRLDILDKNRDGLFDRLMDKGSGIWTAKVGNPSLRNITEISYGVIVRKDFPDTSPKKIYVNELHLTETVVGVGKASRVRADFAWPNWGNWGGSWRDVDRNFQTLTTVASGVDSKLGNVYLNLNRLKFLPLSSNFNHSETVTPQIQTVQDPHILFTVLDEGKVISRSGNLSGQFLMTQVPLIPDRIKRNFLNVDGGTDWSLTKRSAGDREDESLNYRMGSSYSFPWQPDILPTGFLTFKPLPSFLSGSYSRRSSTKRLAQNNTTTESFGQDVSIRTAFQFFPRLSLTPSYSYGEAKEKIVQWHEDKPVLQAVRDTFGEYTKTRNQSGSLSGSLRIFSWLTPGFSYSINTAETYNVNAVVFGTTTFKRGDVKAISRSSNADISASFSPRDLFQYVRYLREINRAINTLNFSGGFTIADADTYENVDSGFETRYWLVPDQLIVRGKHLNLTGQNPFARRASLTATDTSRLSGRWQPFEALAFLKSRLWAPIKNINTSGTFTETKTKRDTTGTQTFSYSRVWPDFVFSTTEIERPLFLYRWMTDTRLNGNYQERLSENLGETRTVEKKQGIDYTFTLFRLLQFSIGYTDSFTRDENLRTEQVTKITKSRGINGQVITTLKWGNWRFTPRYDQSQSVSEDGTGKKTLDQTTRNASLQVFGDVNIPRFFRLPFGKQLALTNRLILTSSFNFNMVRDGVDETKGRDKIDFNMNGDMEVTPNIRVGFGGSFSKTMIPIKKEADEGFSTFGFNSRVTIQF